MIELLKLFWVFFQIGLFTFGGGYAMIPLIRTEIVNNGYLTASQIDQFIGIAESTPGPFAVNIATFVGYDALGFLGALVATLAVVLPSFLIILLIARYSAKAFKSKPIRAILSWINPLMIGLILSAAISVMITAIFGDYPWTEQFAVDYIGLLIFGLVLLVSLLFKKMNPIHLILLSAIFGLIFYSIL